MGKLKNEMNFVLDQIDIDTGCVFGRSIENQIFGRTEPPPEFLSNRTDLRTIIFGSILGEHKVMVVWQNYPFSIFLPWQRVITTFFTC